MIKEFNDRVHRIIMEEHDAETLAKQLNKFLDEENISDLKDKNKLLIWAIFAKDDVNKKFIRDVNVDDIGNDLKTLPRSAGLASDMCGQYERGLGTWFKDRVKNLDETINERLRGIVRAPAPTVAPTANQNQTSAAQPLCGILNHSRNRSSSSSNSR